MSVFIRKVKTSSGATAVQIVVKDGRQVSSIKHIGSAHTPEKLALLMETARQHIRGGQLSLFPKTQDKNPVLALRSGSIFLYNALQGVYEELCFNSIEDDIFKQLVLARIIEPSSKLDTIRILKELGVSVPSYTAIHRCLSRIGQNAYRSQLAKLCFQASQTNNLSLLLYDVTTLYFESQQGDEFRKPGLSKERRLDPQIVVGLLVDRSGFPLEIHEFEGNLAETKTITPVISAFCQRHQLETKKLTITADAGMLSAVNLVELEQAGFSFIVGSRISKTPYQINEHAKSHPNEKLDDGHIFETLQSFGYRKEDRVQRRVIYQYRDKRAKLDLRNIDKQVEKAQRVIKGQAPLKKAPFLKLTSNSKPSLNQQLINEHRLRAGIKGYVTNLPSKEQDPSVGVDPQEIINSYHQLFQVEKSFRMSKSDLKARPVFHRKQDSIKAHLTIVFASLAIAQYVEKRTGISIKKFVKLLKTVQTPTLLINGVETQIEPLVPDNVQVIVEKLAGNCGGGH